VNDAAAEAAPASLKMLEKQLRKGVATPADAGFHLYIFGLSVS